MTHAPGLVVLKPGRGKHGKDVFLLGNTHHNKAEGQDTGGTWALIEQEVTSSNPPLHLHEREDEAFYVLQGRLRVTVGDEEFEGEAGTFILAPRGVPHTYARLPGEPLRLLVLVSPSGLERMFEEIAALPEREQHDPQALGQVTARYGVRGPRAASQRS